MLIKIYILQKACFGKQSKRSTAVVRVLLKAKANTIPVTHVKPKAGRPSKALLEERRIAAELAAASAPRASNKRNNN